jgi:SAM-dependent methyltransferase
MTLPLLYDAHHSQYEDDLPFWLGLAERIGGPLLELGCGSGRVLLPLASAGYGVFGLDNDLVMLRMLRNRLRARGLSRSGQEPVVFQAEMSAFHLGIRFKLILLPCNTWSTLSSTERRSTLDCVRRHLLPGGQFIASLLNPVTLEEIPGQAETEVEEVFEHPLDRNPVQVSSAWQCKEDRVMVWLHYDHLMPDGSVQRQTTRTTHELSPTADYTEEIRTRGMQIKALYGDYDASAYKVHSPYLILQAGIPE